MSVRSAAQATVVVARTHGLAHTLRRIAAEGQRLEDTAGHLLQVVAEMNVRTLEAFDGLVRQAYRANGWHAGPGRPPAEAKAEAVPPLVRTYVSEVRAAFRLGLKVHGFESFYALRRAVQEKRAKLEARAGVWPALRGVRVSSPDKLTGAPFHDLIVIYDHLDETVGEALERALARLIRKYTEFVGELPESAPMGESRE